MLVRLEIPGEVISKGRPRLSRNHVHTPSRTAKAEHSLGWYGRTAMGPRSPSRAALAVEIVVHRPYPSSWSPKRCRRTEFATGRGDLDNIAKTCGDALNGIVWKDDSQIVELRIKRQFTPYEAKTVICVTELGPTADA